MVADEFDFQGDAASRTPARHRSRGSRTPRDDAGIRGCGRAEKLAAVCLDTQDFELVEWFDGKRIEIIPVSDPNTMNLGCNGMALGNDEVISTARSADLDADLRARGFELYDPDGSMFTTDGGGVHCMSMPPRRDSI